MKLDKLRDIYDTGHIVDASRDCLCKKKIINEYLKQNVTHFQTNKIPEE